MVPKVFHVAGKKGLVPSLSSNRLTNILTDQPPGLQPGEPWSQWIGLRENLQETRDFPMKIYEIWEFPVIFHPLMKVKHLRNGSCLTKWWWSQDDPRKTVCFRGWKPQESWPVISMATVPFTEQPFNQVQDTNMAPWPVESCHLTNMREPSHELDLWLMFGSRMVPSCCGWASRFPIGWGVNPQPTFAKNLW